MLNKPINYPNWKKQLRSWANTSGILLWWPRCAVSAFYDQSHSALPCTQVSACSELRITSSCTAREVPPTSPSLCNWSYQKLRRKVTSSSSSRLTNLLGLSANKQPMDQCGLVATEWIFSPYFWNTMEQCIKTCSLHLSKDYREIRRVHTNACQSGVIDTLCLRDSIR